MANNWQPPPPPPPPPMTQATSQPAPVSRALADKNAAYLAKMRAKQKQRNSFNPPSNGGGGGLLGPVQNDQPKKISLFGGDFLNNANIQNNIAKTNGAMAADSPQQKKKSSKYVELPPTGMTEKQLFHKYKIESEKKIGAGAFARIKMVKGVEDGKQYALKMVRKKGRSRGDIEAFKKEILYLSKLTNHPNIIKMYDFCDSPQGLYMVLEFCNGGNVMEKMELIRNYKEEEAKVIVRQIVAGMCYYHQHNIVHRDLKLDNLMFNNGVLKIIDFGLAGDCTDNPLNTPCGTIHFTAPEVLGSYDYTIAADMWSLGVIIYLLICGFPPFFDNTGNEQKLFQIIKKAKFRFIPLYFDECEPCLKELIIDLLKKRPIERLTAQEVRQCEWLTGVKPPPRKRPNLLNQFEDDDDDDDGKEKTPEVFNPFLNKDDDANKGPVAPYLQFQNAWKQQQKEQLEKEKQKAAVPPYMQQQQQAKAASPVSPGSSGQRMPGAPGAAPGGGGQVGYAQQYQQQRQQYAQQQQQGGQQAQYQQYGQQAYAQQQYNQQQQQQYGQYQQQQQGYRAPPPPK
eukprot:CAMPEP_0197027274 /NCGR_PEP_ID=MMETSP1384-20130603/7222_1 /TAXON_ID=29189 /ORGANISM="Ammonia sp." /LENGTH=565 /DNA_ID=CAMNT_0042456097 /DNA_START=19 /DNA_END=1716 /DNA_ORIENTATION=+